MALKQRSALLLGTFTNPEKLMRRYFAFTENLKLFDLNAKGALKRYLVDDGPFKSDGRIKLFRLSDPTVDHYVSKYDRLAVVDFGPLKTPSGKENTDLKFENIVQAIVHAIKYLETNHFDAIDIDTSGHEKFSGVAVALAQSILKSSMSSPPSQMNLSLNRFDDFHLGGEVEYAEGVYLGEGQRLAQRLMKSESVGHFVNTTKSHLGKFTVEILVRDDSWMRKMNMNCILGVAKGSDDRPVVLEIVYDNLGASTRPLILVGKATPYETRLDIPGGDVKRQEPRQIRYRSGMGGACALVGSIYALCKLKATATVRVHCIVAVVWNQPCDKPSKRGDVIRAMNGTSIQVDSPGAEGRLIMADVLSYADTMDSSAIVDVTTLSSNIESILGNSYVACFTSNEDLKQTLQKASESSGEKVWPLPLYKSFLDLLKTSDVADISNVGVDENSATALKSAVFLQEFVSERNRSRWMHLDISAVSSFRGKRNYLLDWATGRSTRLVAEFCVEFFRQQQ